MESRTLAGVRSSPSGDSVKSRSTKPQDGAEAMYKTASWQYDLAAAKRDFQTRDSGAQEGLWMC